VLRSIRYGLYGTVLAGLVAGTVAWGGVDKSVTLVVDGTSTRIHTTAADVSGVLAAAGYHPGAHDIVAPSILARVHDGSEIVFKRGRQLNLDVDGVPRQIWTTAPTVSEALAQLGYPSADFISVSRSKRLPLSATDITVRTPKPVTVVHDGVRRQVTTTDPTVDRLLRDLRIPVGAHDLVSVNRASLVRAGEVIVVRRVRNATLVRTKALPFATTTVTDPKLSHGVIQTVRPGVAGLAKTTYAAVYIDGKLVSKKKLRTVVVKAPTGRIQKLGTAPQVVVTSKPVAPTPTPTPVAAPAPSSGGMMSPAQAQAYARTAVSARGWGSDQFSCLVTLWGHESGWRVNASNGSGAYGIPQALPGSKMGAGWQSDARVQITWGLNYVVGRYGTPCGAWAVWQSQGWY